MKILPAQFDGQSIRRVYDEAADIWWFSVIDVVKVLTDSNNARRYWSDLKRKLAQEAGSEQPYAEIVQLKLPAPDGKQRETDCAKAATLLRIVQSIPSPKAEPIKLWLAKVGYPTSRIHLPTKTSHPGRTEKVAAASGLLRRALKPLQAANSSTCLSSTYGPYRLDQPGTHSVVLR